MRGDLRARAAPRAATTSCSCGATATTCSRSGFLCPKGAALPKLEHDPDRLRRPVVRTGRGASTRPGGRSTGTRRSRIIAERLPAVIDAHGRDAVGVYVGNPGAHNLASLVHGRVLLQALGTTNVFTASTVDQMPKQVSAGLMFGAPLSIPVPDVDRTDYLLVLGREPVRVQRLAVHRARPPGPARGAAGARRSARRRRPAPDADRGGTPTSTCAIRPGTDALFLFALVHVLFADDLVDVGDAPRPHVDGVDDGRRAGPTRSPRTWSPPRLRDRRGDDPARSPASSRPRRPPPSTARIGTCTQEFGTLASWLVDVVNVLTGNLDRPGRRDVHAARPRGAAPPADRPAPGAGVRLGRRTSRVRGAPEVFGEYPAACMAEEIETPGDGQIRALVTVAGNPVLSTPDGARLDRALAVARLHGQRRHLPQRDDPPRRRHPPGAVAARRRATTTSRSTSSRSATSRTTRRRCRARAARDGRVGDHDPARRDRDGAGHRGRRRRDRRDDRPPARRQGGGPRPASNVEGRDPDELMARRSRAGGARSGRSTSCCAPGPTATASAPIPTGCRLAVLEANPHGVDLGPLVPRIPDILRTPSGRIELAPAPIVADVDRLRGGARSATPVDGLVLVGPARPALEQLVDAQRRGAGEGQGPLHAPGAPRRRRAPAASSTARTVRVASSAGVARRAGGGDRRGAPGRREPAPRLGSRRRRRRARRWPAATPGSTATCSRRRDALDPLSGNAVLNGIPVEVSPCP